MDPVARSLEVNGDFMVVLKGQPVPVVAISIGFHDNALGRPKEVDQVALDQHVHIREGKPGLAAKG